MVNKDYKFHRFRFRSFSAYRMIGLKYSHFSYNAVIVTHGVSKVFLFMLDMHKMHNLN